MLGLSGCALDNSCQESALIGTWVESRSSSPEDSLRFESGCALTYVDCGGRGSYTMSTSASSGSTLLTINEWNSMGVGSGPIDCDEMTVGTYDCDYVISGEGDGRIPRFQCARRQPGSAASEVFD